MARERSIVLRLRAEISDYQSKMSQASRSLSDFEREQQKMGGAATTSLGRMVQSAKINEREWTQVGRTMLGVGTAMAGMGVATLKTGIEYNSLRQTATQALTAVTGSTEMAAAQMRRLDEFGRGSFLMRDVLIRAQQQMTGFGIETNKVIPYMSALQDAVAATGGSSQDFEELARLMGQIQSQGKITARELMQFGMRGIDAAQLIGDAMGKTAGQIRDDITAGTLDAGAALDALAEGMGTRFAGASDLVRETFQGAMDNLKAAWRDVSAAFATPLVDPEGGGLLVSGVNTIADSLFRLRDLVEGMPGWMKTGTLAIGSLTTAATLGAGAFMVALPKYAEYRESLQTLAGTHPRLTKLAGGLGKVAGSATKLGIAFAGAVAVTAGVKKLADAIQGFDGADRSIEGVVNRMQELNRSGDAYNAVFGDLVGNVRLNTNEFGDLETAIAKVADPNLADRFFMWLNMDASGIGDVTDRFEDMGRALAQMSQTDLPAAQDAFSALWEEAGGTEAVARDLLDIMPAFRDELIGLANEAGLAANDATLLAIATGQIDPAAQDASDAVMTLEERLDSLSDAQRATLDAGVELAGNLRSARQSFIDWSAAIDTADFSLKDFLKSIEDQNKALLDWDANMDAIKQRGAPQALLDQLVALGADGAPVVAALADANEKDFKRAADAAEIAEGAMDGVGAKYDGLSGKDPIEIIVETDDAILKVNTLTGEIEDLTPTMELGVDDRPARTLFEEFTGYVAAETTPTILDADPRPAEGIFSTVTSGWSRTSTPTNLDLNEKPSQQVFTKTTRGWNRTTTKTNLDLDDMRAMGRFGSTTKRWGGTITKTGLDLNPSRASGTFSSTTSRWRNTTTNTNLGLNTGGARTMFERFVGGISNRTVGVGVRINTGKYGGGFISKGLYGGGTVLPGRMAGGKVPGARAGYDNVMWPLHSGGRVLTQPLEGGEYVVRSSQANRADYAPILEAMNRGTFQAAPGPSVVVSALSDSDVARIAVAVREGAAVGSERGTRVGAREGLDATSRRAGMGAGQNMGW